MTITPRKVAPCNANLMLQRQQWGNFTGELEICDVRRPEFFNYAAHFALVKCPGRPHARERKKWRKFGTNNTKAENEHNAKTSTREIYAKLPQNITSKIHENSLS